MEYARLIASLENHNRQPKLVGEGPSQRPLFDAGYNWDEQKRVVDAIQSLVDSFEEALPFLAEAIGDNRYCLTLQHDQSVDNYTVGDVCSRIIKDNLVGAFSSRIPVQAVAFKVRNPDLIMPDLKSWFKKQLADHKDFYELQIEMCRWAISKIGGLESVSTDDKEMCVKLIEESMQTIQMTKKPVLIKAFIDREFRAPFSARRAELIRSKLENRN